MKKLTNSKKISRQPGRRDGSPVALIPKSRVFVTSHDLIFAVTSGSKMYPIGKRPKPSRIISVTIPDAVDRVLAVRLIIQVAVAISIGPWPGDFTTGIMTEDTAVDCLWAEEQDRKKLRRAKAAGLDTLDETGPMWIHPEEVVPGLIDRLLQVLGESPPSTKKRVKQESRG
jgi:hypothetical protein